MNPESLPTAAALEALLFTNGVALSCVALEKLLSVNSPELQTLLDTYEEVLAQREGSLVLIRDHKSVRLGVAPQYHGFLEGLVKSELQETLSKAALEVLAIVAYLAPIARSQIDAIRGVNSHFTLRNLALRGLINRNGNPGDARGYIYSPSMDFLTTLGMSSISKLPHYEALRGDQRLQRLQNKETTEELLEVTE
jgi:segregation and condensation protein B